MRKILLSIFIMIFGFQGVATAGPLDVYSEFGLIDMDSGNALKMQVKVEAVERALKEKQEARGINKNNFMGFVSEYYLLNNILTLDSIFRACMLSTKKQTICMPFIRVVVDIHNSLVSTSTLPYGRLTEQEFNNIVAKGIKCPADTVLSGHLGLDCGYECRKWATKNICYLINASYNEIRGDWFNCICNSSKHPEDTAEYFLPDWYDYKRFVEGL